MHSRSRNRQSSALLQSPVTKKRTTTQSPKVKPWFGSRNLLLKKFFLTLTGIIICGIPLAVVTSLYVKEIQSCYTTTTSAAQGAAAAGSANTTISWILPSQCSSYTTINDSSRNILAGSGSLCDNTLATGWYRFIGNGTMLATFAVSIYSCTSAYTGWYNGSMPSTPGTTASGSLCVNNAGFLCYSTYSGVYIGVTNCNNFFVYYLSHVLNCNTRYCTMN